MLGVVTGEELPEPLLHGELPHPGTLAEEEVPSVDQCPAGVLVRRLGQLLPQPPQAVEAAGPLEGPGVALRVGGGDSLVDVLGQDRPVGVPKVRRDQQGVHRLAPGVAVPDGLEDALGLLGQEVLLRHGHHHRAHRGLVDEH